MAAQTPEMWVPNEPDTWMYVCVVCVVLLCVSRSLATGWPPVQLALPSVIHRVLKVRNPSVRSFNGLKNGTSKVNADNRKLCVHVHITLELN